jgi:hypothetical protein
MITPRSALTSHHHRVDDIRRRALRTRFEPVVNLNILIFRRWSFRSGDGHMAGARA